jgi:ribonuclease-3
MQIQTSNPETLENLLGYRFGDRDLLQQALVHRSFVHEHPHDERKDNETLEFLGDAVLGLAVSHLLLETYPQCNEGELSRMRSAVVNEKELARIARDLEIGPFLCIGKGEEQTGGREKPSLLADTLEALLGAVYLDGGLDAAVAVVKRLYARHLDPAAAVALDRLNKDYKTRLQEMTQGRYRVTPQYSLVAEEGPDHDKRFRFTVILDGREVAEGSGKTKKEAQQAAAKRALEDLVPEEA